MPVRLRSFDQTQASVCRISQPTSVEDLAGCADRPIIARGAGLSYCSAGAVDGGCVLDMRAMCHVLGFDEQNGRATVAAGITIGTLHNFAVSRGWMIPVMPGYPSITVGGCVAFNVHGKGQTKDGNFREIVHALTVWHPRYGLDECSETRNRELLDLTVGGLGLTGVIAEVTLKLRRLPGDRVVVRRLKAENLRHAADLLLEHADSADHAYSWNDLNRRHRTFGRGIVYVESHVPGFSDARMSVSPGRLARWTPWPLRLPEPCIPAMCRAYDTVERLRPESETISYARAAFPISGRELYFAQFGRRGFREYQVLFPIDLWPAAASDVERAIAHHGVRVALGSLKRFRGTRHNLSLSGDGLCVALDVANGPRSDAFFEALDDITLRHGGTINLSKDSRASAALVQSVFPGYEAFREAIRSRDPSSVFQSDLSRRIEV